MKRMSTTAIAALVVAVFAVAVPHTALALGTTANTSVDNTVVVNWNAGAVAYSTNDTASFVVDRLVTFTVTNNTATALTVDVFPGVVGGEPDINVLTFGVYNASNTTLDFALSATNNAGPVTSNLTIYADDGDRVFDTSTDVIAATLDNLPADTAFYVFVVGDIASTAATPDVDSVDLRAQALSAVAGTPIADLGGAWQAGTMQSVLADTSGTWTTPADGDYDGYHSDRGYFQLVMPELSVTKAITAVTDARAFNPAPSKAIPGATVSYRLVVENTGTGAATGVVLTDTLSTSVDVLDVSNVSASAGTTSLTDTDPDTLIWTVGGVATASSENLTYDVTIP